MTSFGPSVAQSVAGNAQAQRLTERTNAKRTNERLGPRKRPEDEVEVELVQNPEAVRKVKDDDQAQDDLRQHHPPKHDADADTDDAESDEDTPLPTHIDLEG